MTKFDKLLDQLVDINNSRNTSCADFCKFLRKFGFEIRDCGSAGHKVIIHPCIPLLENAHFNCGHNDGEAIKPPYVKKICKLIRKHENEIREYFDEKQNKI